MVRQSARRERQRSPRPQGPIAYRVLVVFADANSKPLGRFFHFSLTFGDQYLERMCRPYRLVQTREREGIPFGGVNPGKIGPTHHP
jgi:hypothetical protein